MLDNIPGVPILNTNKIINVNNILNNATYTTVYLVNTKKKFRHILK